MCLYGKGNRPPHCITSFSPFCASKKLITISMVLYKLELINGSALEIYDGALFYGDRRMCNLSTRTLEAAVEQSVITLSTERICWTLSITGEAALSAFRSGIHKKAADLGRMTGQTTCFLMLPRAAVRSKGSSSELSFPVSAACFRDECGMLFSFQTLETNSLPRRSALSSFSKI